VNLSVGDNWEKWYPNKRGATVRIIEKSGREWTAEVELARGEPENPATWEEIYKKFYVNATSLISGKEATALGDVIMNLEDHSVDSLTKAPLMSRTV